MTIKQRYRRFIKRALSTTLKNVGLVEKRLKKGGVIILMFHKIDEILDQLPLTIPPSVFDQILTELESRSEIVPIESILDDNGALITDKEVKFVITFDDGYKNNYEKAYPILKKHNAPAIIYLSYGHIQNDLMFWYERLSSGIRQTCKKRVNLTDIGSENFTLSTPADKDFAVIKLNQWLKLFSLEKRMRLIDTILDRLEVAETKLELSPMLSWEMIKEMQGNQITFGSHTITHPILSREDPEIIEKEIVESRQLIEDKIGKPVTGFAYPNGTVQDYNELALRYVRKTYFHACTTETGINHEGQDPHQLLRINVDPGMCMDENGKFLPNLFWAKLTELI